jgi:hypothetical protein
MRKISTLLIVLGLILGGCCDKDFITPTSSPDFIEGAIDITSLITGSCAPSQASYFTTVGATPDGGAGECWFNTGPLHNVWFKFLPPPTLNGTISVYVGSTFGTQRRTNLTLWDTDGTTELNCSTFGNDDDIVSLYHSGYTSGQFYYISVDVQDSPSVGTFSLCLTDTD